MKWSNPQYKLLAMRSKFKQTFSWIDHILLVKWSKAYDRGKKYDHITTNLAKCMNFILKGARSLLIFALLKETFERIKTWCVEQGLKINMMLHACHYYAKDIITLFRKKINKMCFVQRLLSERIMKLMFKN